MHIFKAQPTVSKAALALRAYLAQAPQAELDARLARVKALHLPQSPTVADLLVRPTPAPLEIRVHATAAIQARYAGPVVGRDSSADAYSNAMAA